MNVSVFEIGNFYDVPNITKIFYTKESAIKKIPPGFKRVDVFAPHNLYYKNNKSEKWLTIKTYKIEE